MKQLINEGNAMPMILAVSLLWEPAHYFTELAVDNIVI